MKIINKIINKKIIISAVILAVLFAAAAVYTNKRTEHYNENRKNVFIRVYFCNHEYNGFVGDLYYNVYIIKNYKKDCWDISGGRRIDPYDVPVHRLTQFEYCLIRDYLEYMVGHPDGTNDVHSIDLFVTYDGERSFYTRTSAFSVKLLAFWLTALVYIRSHYIYAGFALAVYAFVLCRLLKKYFEGTKAGFGQRVLFLARKSRIQLEFLIINISAMLLIDRTAHASLCRGVINRLYTSLYKTAENSEISESIFFVHRISGCPFGINILVWLLFTAMQLKYVWELTRGSMFRRYLAAYIPPAVILLVLQEFIFLKLLPDSGTTLPGLYNFVINYIGINEGAYFHPRVVCFVWFFVIGFVLFLLFGKTANPDIRKKFAWSTVFAAIIAFMCCLEIYNVDFGANEVYYFNNTIYDREME